MVVGGKTNNKEELRLKQWRQQCTKRKIIFRRQSTT